MSDLIAFVTKNMLSLIILGAVAVASALGFASTRLFNVSSDTQTLASNIQTTYSTFGNFGSLSADVCYKLAPQGMKANGTSTTNNWGGAVTCGVDAANSSQFFISQTKVPSESCGKFVSVSGALSVQINGGTSYTQSGSGALDPGVAVSLCNAANDENTVRLVFGRS